MCRTGRDRNRSPELDFQASPTGARNDANLAGLRSIQSEHPAARRPSEHKSPPTSVLWSHRPLTHDTKPRALEWQSACVDPDCRFWLASFDISGKRVRRVRLHAGREGRTSMGAKTEALAKQ